MNSKITYLFLIAALAILNVSCGMDFQPGWQYLIDNPLDTAITIDIDGKEYTIAAQTTDSVKLSQGKHTLTYNGSSVNFVTKVNSKKSVTIMNPTLSNYMLHSYFYISEKSSGNIDYIYDQNSYEYICDEGIVKLPVRVLNSLFIEKAHTNWAYGLDKDVKSEIRTSSPRKQNVFHKLYRGAEYEELFADELPAGIVFPVNSKKLSEQPVYMFPTETLLCDCEAANTAIRELEERWNKIIADPSDIFQEVGKLNYAAATDIRNTIIQNCSAQYNPGRDDKESEEVLSRLSKVTSYLSNASSFIVE